VVTADGTADGQALRAHLQRRLPDHMVPSAYVALAALPLMANGKLDRRALPPPAREANVGPYVPPQTPVQARLASIWGEVLRFKRVGIHDDFFALGGHSLLLVRVQTKIAIQFGRQVPIVKLFEHPTIATLATYLSQMAMLEDSIEGGQLRAHVRRKAHGRRRSVVTEPAAASAEDDVVGNGRSAASGKSIGLQELRKVVGVVEHDGVPARAITDSRAAEPN
jgi:hypothetical protein